MREVIMHGKFKDWLERGMVKSNLIGHDVVYY